MGRRDVLFDLPQAEDECSVLEFVTRETIAAGSGHVEAWLFDPADGPSVTGKLARHKEPDKLRHVALDVLLRHRLCGEAEGSADERDDLVSVGFRQAGVRGCGLSPKIEEMGCSSKASAKQALGHQPGGGLDVLLWMIRKSCQQPPTRDLWTGPSLHAKQVRE